jgi:hypothetical protein
MAPNVLHFVDGGPKVYPGEGRGRHEEIKRKLHGLNSLLLANKKPLSQKKEAGCSEPFDTMAQCF